MLEVDNLTSVKSIVGLIVRLYATPAAKIYQT
jgi:hypothetical protein